MPLELIRERRRQRLREAALNKARSRSRARKSQSTKDRRTGTRDGALPAASSTRGWLLEALGFHGLDAVEESLLVALVTGEPLLLVGRHGTAKTAVCRVVGEVLDLDFHAYDAAKALFEDVVGFPNPASLAEGQVDYVPTPVSLWDREMILIDELSRAQPQMQNKWLEVIRSRRLMGRALPRLQYVLAAMNPTDYLGAVPLDEALVARFALIAPMPAVHEMSGVTARQVIRARTGDDAPMLGDLDGAAPERKRLRTRLRRLLTVARRRISKVEARWGRAVVEYVFEVGSQLADRGHPLDGRRLGMMRRNLLAALALEAGAGRRGAPKEPTRFRARLERTLAASLPFAAQTESGPSEEILGAIRDEAFERAYGADIKDTNSGEGETPGMVRPRFRRQIRDYVRRLDELELDEHYLLANETIRREQEAPPEKLRSAWGETATLANVLRDNADRVPWMVTEHVLDAWAESLGISNVYAPELTSFCESLGLRPREEAAARLARQCLAVAAREREGDTVDQAEELYQRLGGKGGM